MLKIISFIFLLCSLAYAGNSQDKYFTKTGKIEFDATASNSPEEIEAIHKNVISVLDTKTGNFQFSVLMTGFEFQRALMQEHFNENYVESTKYPKSDFKGVIAENGSINYSKDGVYSVTVKGSLTMHGVSKSVEVPGKIEIKSGKIIANATFNVLLSDYQINVPQLVVDKVAKTAKITVNCNMEPLK